MFLDYNTVAALSDNAAFRLAQRALTDNELREALQTSASHHGVRIGKCQIVYRTVDGNRVFDIEFGRHDICGIAFYETAREIAKHINNGEPHNGIRIAELVAMNAEYHRAKESAEYHSRMTDHYMKRRLYWRGYLNENKFSRDMTRAQTLKHRLLNMPLNY